MGIVAVKNKILEISDILQKNGFDSIHEQLHNFLEELDKPSSQKEVLKKIIGLCHIRILGDLNIKTIDYKNWLNHIDKLQTKARKALRQLQNPKL